YPEFDCAEKRVHPKVPPDFFGIVYAVCLDKRLEVIVVRLHRIKIFRQACPWKFRKNLCSKRLKPGVSPLPKRRVSGQGVEVRKEIAGLIHQLEGNLPAFDAHVYVQPKDQI